MSYPMGYVLSVRAVEAEVNSARPGSPVVPEGAPRTPAGSKARTRIATGLQWLAQRVEPAERGTLTCTGAADGC